MSQKNTKGKRIAVLLMAIALFITTTSLVLIDGKKKNVTMDLNGKQIELRTAASTVEEVLAANDVQVKKHDYLEPAMHTPLENGLAIKWQAAKKVSIALDGDTQELWTTEKTVQDVLKTANIEINTHDEVEPALATTISDNQAITIAKAFQVTVNDGGKESTHWSTSTTVADFLKDQNIRLNNLDKVEGDSKALLTTSNAVVNIARVEKVTDVVEVPADFKVKRKTDLTMLKGEEKVTTEGKKGKIQQKFEITKKNGKIVSRELVSKTVIEEPTHKVVNVGAKVVVASADTAKSTSKAQTAKSANVGVSRNNEPSGGGKEFYANASAYTAYCNGCSGITATGINLRANPNMKLIAVDPRVIPLGSKVWVEGYGYAIAGDTGGAIKGNRIDLHMPTKEAAYQFGRRQVKIKVIN
ncbi:ubiquitin-like domain-containing protein [Sporosarcina sp. GW1-11]|uniref:ubiquitin-like domain-containing protein n=1 Tax=Sporosarcina sp. GW1-11 TaxID=2899126 RepID=UPI002955A7EF|nr:ubiquitin-like domain-containing protein [Sporosarcina sp. GW1-11]